MKQVLKNIIKIAIVVIFIVAIVVLGIKIYLYCKAQQVINTAEKNLTGLSTDLRNSELLKYEGEIKGSRVRQLINTVNYFQKDWPITLSYADNQAHSSSEVKSSSTLYTVSFDIDEDTGFVSTVHISGITDVSH